jgi:mRNA-degrading endonuclease RelE of RelBE toxin-antitoxin system
LRYDVAFSEGALKQLKALPKPVRSRIEQVQQLADEVDRLRERVEDLEDLRDLNDAVRRNNGKPLLPWTKVKKDLELD